MPIVNMKPGLIAAAALSLVGCAAHPLAEESAHFTTALALINQQLNDPSFQTFAVVHFENFGPCKAQYKSIWSHFASARMGFTNVEETTPVDFVNNVQKAEHVAAHDDKLPGRIESWREQIRLNFKEPVQRFLRTTAGSNTQTSSQELTSNNVGIGISKTATTDQVRNLVQELNSIVELCKKQPT